MDFAKLAQFQHDSLVVVIMSHGEQGSVFLTCDGRKILLEDVINYFDAVNCPQMAGKPKIFFFNCCRGDRKNCEIKKVCVDGPRRLHKEPTNVRQHQDIVIAYSTIPGFIYLFIFE